MSEVLRELVVALSLDSDNFSRNLRTINQQIKEAESTFKLAGAGIKNFETSLKSTEARLALLTSKQKEQSRAVEQYSRALLQANQKLLASGASQEKMKASLEQARAEYARQKAAVNAAGQQYNRFRATLGDADSATIASKQNLEQLKVESLAARDKVKLLEGQIKSNTKTLQNNADAISKATTNLNLAKAELKEVTQELYRQQSAWTKAGNALTTFGKKSDNVSKNLVSAGRGFTRAITTPILALGGTAIKASIDYESAFTSVRKTVDATEEEFAILSDAIKEMSTHVASSSVELAEVTAVAGKLGVTNDNLTAFTKTMIDLGNSTDIDATGAAETLAKFANITQMDQSKFQNLGSTLVDLGNNYAATESQILEMSLRLAGAGHQVGLSESQIIGFSAALAAVGIEAQMGGSAFSKALIKMEVASETGGQALKDFAKVSGMTTQQFKALWDANPAEAFQAFLGGLSKIDDEGASAIATLSEIGFSEIRLRDTMMRATNATKLFRDTQNTANAAWTKNTALLVEANKRYATTQSKLTNLKNTALLFAQKLGDDMNPAIQGVILKANEMLAAFMGMDESQRMAIIKFAGFAAAIGPALLILGKTLGVVGKLSTGLGKFSLNMGKLSASVKMAGGGLGGFVKTAASSKLAVAALAAALVYGVATLVDYATGARQAREALEGMSSTANKWKATAADTFYGKGGFSLLGLSAEDFTRDKKNATDWMNGLLGVWADGKYKKKAVIEEWTASFKGMTAITRESLQEMQTDAKGAGYTSLSDQMEADIKTLDSMDTELTRLLQRRRSGKLSNKEKLRLQELVDAREAIEIRYKLTAADAEGFESIRKKVEAEQARALARGEKDAGVSVYEAAVVASAEGMAAVNAQLDSQYDKEYSLIQLMADASQREAATAALNARYIENRKIAAAEYAALLKDMVLPVWNQGDIQKTDQDIDTLYAKLREYNLASSQGDEWGMANALEDMNKLTAGMDEGKVAEYLGLLTQIQALMDSGMSAEEVTALFPEIDVTGQMEQVAALTQFVTDNKTALSGLATMFTGALPEEVLKIATDLDMTGAQTRWSEFATNPGAITTQAVVDGYTESETAVKLQPKVTAFVEKYTEVAAGASKASLTPAGLVAYVSSYAETVLGADISGLTPTNITAMVAAYKELAAGADVTALTPDEITAYIKTYLEKEGVDTTGLTPDGLTAFVLAYEEATGGASTVSLTPGGVAAMVTSYLEAEGIDISTLSKPQLAAIVTAYAEATNVDTTQLGVEVNALIASYKDKEGVVKPTYIESQIAITGYDLTAYNAFVAANPVNLTGVVRLSEKYESPTEVLNDPNATFWENGKEIPVNLVPASKINADTLMAYEADGTLHVLITPQISGTKEAVDAAAAELTAPGTGEGARTGRTFTAIDPVYLSIFDRVRMLTKQLEGYSSAKGGILDFDFLGLGAKGTIKGALAQTMDADTVAGLQTYVAEVVAAIKAGEPVEQADMDNLQAILDFVSSLEVAGVGENIVAGISGAMAQAGWSTDAETTAGNLEAAINLALGIQSPSTRMIPVGQNAAAGIGQGFSTYDMTGTVSNMADTLSRLAIQYISPRLLYTQGLQAMAGLSAGIRAGQAGVVRAMVQAAQAAVDAAKRALLIRSPSRVFRDEIGRMTMKGWGQGMLLESREQARVVANAARYLTDSAKESSVAYATNDNRRTYNQSSKVNLTGNTFYVRDDKDIQSLAIEIAALTRRQHQSRGLRMA